MTDAGVAARDGVVLLDKPLGLSSQQASLRLRRLLGAARAGHVGSLDPLATGMLPVCIGEATKVAGLIVEGEKCYRFTVELGARTATGDREGEVVEQRAVPELTAEAVAQVLARFIGQVQQIPPMYSALKQQGQPLYKLARAGLTVVRPPRAIEIHALTLLQLATPQLLLQVRCGKGTYVRTLAEDIAAALGTVGHVRELRREWVAPFAEQPMQALAAADAATLSLLPAHQVLAHLPNVELTAEALQRLQQGQALTGYGTDAAPVLMIRDVAGACWGLATCDAGGVLRPKRLFVRPW